MCMEMHSTQFSEKHVTNRNNGLISYIKTFRNKEFLFLFSIAIDTLDTDRSYLVNDLSFLLCFLMIKEGLDRISYNENPSVLSYFSTHF